MTCGGIRSDRLAISRNGAHFSEIRPDTGCFCSAQKQSFRPFAAADQIDRQRQLRRSGVFCHQLVDLVTIDDILTMAKAIARTSGCCSTEEPVLGAVRFVTARFESGRSNSPAHME
jgi:hypothetical protein